MRFPPVDEQLERLRRGVVDCVSEPELRERLEQSRRDGRPLRVKFGIDPSSPDIHLGHTVPLRKLREFQRLGHEVVVLWGTATAMVGDPTGRNRTRPQLTRAQVAEHQSTYADQIRGILAMDQVVQRENGEWFDRMTFMDAVKLTARYTVAQILERESFAERMRAGTPISIHEMIYPLMQGWDSVELQCDVEIGGGDQLFNLLVGRELQRQQGQRPQICLTVPILEGLDGVQKMSKSLGNAIGIRTPAPDMYGKVMSLPDELMRKYFVLLTDLDTGAIDRLLAGHPRVAKATLARAIVGDCHGAGAAERAAAEFDRVFREGGLPDEIPELHVPPDALRDGRLLLAEALRLAGLCSSNSDGRRQIVAGGVRVDGALVADATATLGAGRFLVQVGKRKASYVRIDA
jgi:tyrosyl-tRNA synthetase